MCVTLLTFHVCAGEDAVEGAVEEPALQSAAWPLSHVEDLARPVQNPPPLRLGAPPSLSCLGFKCLHLLMIIQRMKRDGAIREARRELERSILPSFFLSLFQSLPSSVSIL